mmetsp:Transcript_53896/g.115760  ORF Transcript_53896/g.115760 Transcript_53896/m.115760 type:complete len:300 (+) Transcript_53896:41-940(+)
MEDSLDGPQSPVARGSTDTILNLGQKSIGGKTSSPTSESTPQVRRSSTAPSLRASTGSLGTPMGTLGTLKLAISKAKNAGVNAKEVRNVEQLLEQEEAKERINKAVEKRDAKMLRTALDRAKCLVKTEKEFVDRAKAFMKELEATSLLEHALAVEDTDELRLAIEKARDADMDVEQLEKFEKILGQMRSQQMLKAAIDSKDITLLKWSLKEVRNVDVKLDEANQKDMAAAKQMLSELEKLRGQPQDVRRASIDSSMGSVLSGLQKRRASIDSRRSVDSRRSSVSSVDSIPGGGMRRGTI